MYKFLLITFKFEAMEVEIFSSLVVLECAPVPKSTHSETFVFRTRGQSIAECNKLRQGY